MTDKLDGKRWGSRALSARQMIPVFAGLLYAASLLLPAGRVVVKPPSGVIVEPLNPFYGFNAFLIAMLSPLEPSWEAAWLFSAWLANPIFSLALFWCVRANIRRAATGGLLSVGLGLSILPLVWELVIGCPGYWAWLASFAILLLGSLFEMGCVGGHRESSDLSAIRPISSHAGMDLRR